MPSHRVSIDLANCRDAERLWTPAESKTFDQAAIGHGLTASMLMENAGRSAFDVYVRHFGLKPALVVGGPGNNGGDGWVLARHLRTAGVDVTAVLIGDKNSSTPEAALAWGLLGEMGIPHAQLSDADSFQSHLLAIAAHSGIVVDALFGIGLVNAPHPPFSNVIEMINKSGRPVLSLDVPSGVNAESGQVPGETIKANVTVTFGAKKTGLLNYPGAAHVGSLQTGSLGCPVTTWDKNAAGPVRYQVGPGCLQMLKQRNPDSHKGDAAKVLVVGAHQNYVGASVLTALGALRSGSSIVRIAYHHQTEAKFDFPEIMQLHIDQMSESAWHKVAAGFDVAVIGPGLGQEPESRSRLEGALSSLGPLAWVLDADALNLLAEPDLVQIVRGHRDTVITPHPLEAARLLSCSVDEVQRDRFASCEALAKEFGVTAVLKGAGTVISDGSTTCVINSGHPRLAVGGSGDVLSGVVASLLHDHTPLDAAWLAALWHGRAGEVAGPSDRGTLASEIADALPRVRLS